MHGPGGMTHLQIGKIVAAARQPRWTLGFPHAASVEPDLVWVRVLSPEEIDDVALNIMLLNGAGGRFRGIARQMVGAVRPFVEGRAGCSRKWVEAPFAVGSQCIEIGVGGRIRDDVTEMHAALHQARL